MREGKLNAVIGTSESLGAYPWQAYARGVVGRFMPGTVTDTARDVVDRLSEPVPEVNYDPSPYVLSIQLPLEHILDTRPMQTTTPESDRPTRSASGYDLTPLRGSARESAVADAGLSAEERRILIEHGTERPGCGLLLHTKEEGLYACRLCGLPLFRSASKFESGTGWPSFFEPVDPDHVAEIEDRSLGMVRIETRCARCDGHLGHVFPDGPRPTGLRYCMNSAALAFYPEGKTPPQRTASDPVASPS